ncbi:flagellin N-terminal helical domain-containing protein [Budvicia aquatica]|uniref:flagellin N-terminal helical domain-containing protein n=1 Tax=Budvicia aquatica TaxID=82979 RepID=UPI00207E2CF4|nr:flagellin [Budvicia aquatica]GKX50167.1 flagellin [Budvicia aquatica]
MSLSIFTNASSMASTNALNKSNNALATAMERLGTGKRINSAADDAAGLQIATRLQAQSNGMGVAQRNISDATAMLQTAEGAFDEVTNIMHRMKDLATQASNGTNTDKDLTSMQSEFKELGTELGNIMGNTSYSGDKLFTKLGTAVDFQIGASSSEKMTLDISADLEKVTDRTTDLGTASIATGAAASTMIDTLNSALDEVSTVRSSLGANINRLGHTSNNLSNMKDNTDVAIGNIMDADFAAEASSMTRNQMLSQTSMSMLKQSNSMSGMVMSLLG